MHIHDDTDDIEYREAVGLQARQLSDEQILKFEGYAGVAVFLEAHHLCMQMRGVRETAPMTRTTVWRGQYAEDPALRAEFFMAFGLQQNGSG
jgi:GTP cyclohydrolase I